MPHLALNFTNVATLARHPRMLPKFAAFYWSRVSSQPLRIFDDIFVSDFPNFSEFWSVSKIIPTPGERSFFESKCPKEGVILDVGANIGLFSLYFSRLRPCSAVYAFEPCADTFRRLEKNIKLNGCENILPMRKALSDREGSAELVPSGSSHMHRIDQFSAGGGRVERVQVQSVDEFCEEQSIKNVGFLKIDVEGADVDVLFGAEKLFSRRLVHAGQIEFAPSQYARYSRSVSDLCQFIDYHGYVLVSLEGNDLVEVNFRTLTDLEDRTLLNLGFIRHDSWHSQL